MSRADDMVKKRKRRADMASAMLGVTETEYWFEKRTTVNEKSSCGEEERVRGVL